MFQVLLECRNFTDGHQVCLRAVLRVADISVSGPTGDKTHLLYTTQITQ